MADELETIVSETPADVAQPTDETKPDVSSESVPSSPDAPVAETEWQGTRDYMKSRGYAADHFSDDAAALDHLVAQAQRTRELEVRHQQLEAWYHHQQQQQAAQQAPQQAQQAAEKKPYWDKPPEYDPAWLKWIQTDREGNRTVSPGGAPDLLQKIQNYAQWREKQLTKLLQDPVEATWSGIEDRLGSMFEQREQALAAKLHADFQARQYLRDNAQYLFQFDQNGQPLSDPSTGQPAFSPYGQAFAAYLNQAAQMGIPSHASREQYARSMAQAWLSQQQPAQQAAQQAQPNRLKQAMHNPNRSGTEAAAGNGKGRVPQNDNLSFSERLKQNIVREYGSLEALDASINL